jgi:glycosyltransferase involved in cell wall biosynthesis
MKGTHMGHDRPLITAIIPTYRRPNMVRRAIISVLDQSFTNFQICVYDNASGDETEEVVRELARQDHRVKYYCHPENIGSIPNFNYGIERIETPFFSMLSDDDLVLPDFYKETLKGFDMHPEAMFSAGSVVSMMDNGQIIGDTFSSWSRDGYFTPPNGLFEMIGGSHPIFPGMLFRKQVVDIFKGMDPDVVMGDLDWELRIAARFPFFVSRKPCGVFMCHSTSSGMLAGSSSIWPSCLKVIRNLRDDSDITPEIREYAERALTKYFIKMIFELGVRSSIRSDFADAKVAEVVLREYYRDRIRAFIVENLICIFERAWVINKLAYIVYRSLGLIRKVRNRRVHGDFIGVTRYLIDKGLLVV